MRHTERIGLSRTLWILFLFVTATTVIVPAQTYTLLLSFDDTHGAFPTSSLVQGVDGSLYGATVQGGTNSGGTVFRVTPSGNLTTLYSFCAQPYCVDGSYPYGGVIQGSDGNFYGTTYYGGGNSGANRGGTVFRVTPSGNLTTLYSFCAQPNCVDGSEPYGGLVQASDGNFYGTTSAGGGSGCGTVFKITPTGTLTTLHSFVSTDGAGPLGQLVQANDGNLYGTTAGGAANNSGTVFRITMGGTFTTLYRFCSRGNCTDGWVPYAGLVQALDGGLYGTTVFGGTSGAGTVFGITLGGSLTTLHSFNTSDGSEPYGELVQATDGNFYGTTAYGGGPSLGGTVFKITPTGTLTTLHSFAGYPTDGSYSQGGLLQATDGNLYGMTRYGGTNGSGTVFKISTGLPPFVETQPTIGAVGTPVTILGTNLTGATSVSFNGTPATFNVVSASEITTTVPAGATTGTVQVAIPGSTLISNTDFQVTGPLQLVPVTPCRLVDTRETGGPIQGGTSRSFTVPQLGSCGIPTSAAAYSLNVSVVPQGPLGYLTIWPTDEVRPVVATLTSLDGRIKADAAIVPAGTSGAVSVYVTNTTNVVLDINGYFEPVSGSTLAFYPLPPCRVADTRFSTYPPGLGSPFLTGGQQRDFPIRNATTCNIPASAQAYSLNFSVVPHGALFYMTVWPTGETRPLVSTLNDIPGQIIANAAIVPAGTNGEVAVYPTNNTDLIIDINGYFAPAGPGGLSLYPVAPCRVIDTRHIGSGQPFSGTLSPPVNVVGSPCEPPPTAQAYVFNATVVPTGALGYLTLWPDAATKPLVSTLNALDGTITNNMAIVPTTNGKVDAYASGLTQLILDISSYFAP